MTALSDLTSPPEEPRGPEADASSTMRLGGPAGAEHDRPAATTPVKAGPAAGPAGAPVAAGAPAPVAVIVVHGMGQQLPFETLDAVVEGLRRSAAAVPPHGAGLARPTVRLARVGGTDLPRAEMALRDAQGGPRPVHLYEAYWAPHTEGRVTLRDVVAFLGRSALNGIRNARAQGGFRRWMFGRFIRRPRPPRVAAQLGLALAVLGALLLVNAAVVAALAGRLAGLGGGFEGARRLFSDTALSLGPVLLGILASTWLMFVTRRLGLFFAALALVMLLGALAGLMLVGHGLLASLLPWLPERPAPWTQWAGGAVALLLVVGTLVVRQLLVQYMGDVAAYVTPHALDKFQELREKIKETVRSVASAVYRHRVDGLPVYSRIAVVGHSLGSVAAYDALNGLLNGDDLADPKDRLDVQKRTCLLLTFGSPLDKTAFLFKAQGHALGETREALAAAVQPLIQDYRFRTFPWVNLHSRQDIISGPLDLYDDPKQPASPPGQPPFKVDNREDPAARTPLVAHVEYWRGTLVFDVLGDALVRP